MTGACLDSAGLASSGQTSQPARGDDPAGLHERLRTEAEAALVPVEWNPGGEGVGPVLADLVTASAPDPSGRIEAAFAVEAIFEGFLCHQGTPRLFRATDADLALLTGDLLYALGLRAVASAGDTDSVRILAELIATAAGLASEGRSGPQIALWAAQALALGAPPAVGSDALPGTLLDGTDPDGDRLLELARDRASTAGADAAFGRAVDALQSVVQMGLGNR